MPWVESVGISYKLGIDGISLWLVLLTTLLTPIALFASWTSITTKVKEYAIAFLLLQVGMLGAFVALDLFLFYVFWELMLVPTRHVVRKVARRSHSVGRSPRSCLLARPLFQTMPSSVTAKARSRRLSFTRAQA